MNTSRKFAILTGVLFLAATPASIVGSSLAGSINPTALAAAAENANSVVAGVVLYLLAALLSGSIALALYPVLKEYHAGLALGAVVWRIVEATFYMVVGVCLLVALTLSRQWVIAEGGERTTLAAAASLILSVREHAAVVGVIAFCLGGTLYYYAFWQTQLVPRWLSGWGLVAMVAMLVACGLALFEDKPVTGYILLALPIGIQELALAVWLIVKGFAPAVAPAPASRSVARPLRAA